MISAGLERGDSRIEGFEFPAILTEEGNGAFDAAEHDADPDFPDVIGVEEHEQVVADVGVVDADDFAFRDDVLEDAEIEIFAGVVAQKLVGFDFFRAGNDGGEGVPDRFEEVVPGVAFRDGVSGLGLVNAEGFAGDGGKSSERIEFAVSHNDLSFFGFPDGFGNGCFVLNVCLIVITLLYRNFYLLSIYYNLKKRVKG